MPYKARLKQGEPRKRKMHLWIDADMNVHAIRITTTDVPDSEGMCDVLPADLPVDRVIADGAYYSIDRTEALLRAGVTPVIPLPAHAFLHGGEDTRWHDETLNTSSTKGLCVPQEIRLWPARAGRSADLAHQAMHWRNPADAEDRLAGVRGVIIANLINLWNAFGKPVCVRNA
jgi:hypothetical protein